MVGSGFVKYYQFFLSMVVNFIGFVSGNFCDVYFYDDMVGYIVGDVGKFYWVILVFIDFFMYEIFVFNYVSKLLEDGIVIVLIVLNLNIYVIVFGFCYDGVWGGEYFLVFIFVQYKFYVRMVND